MSPFSLLGRMMDGSGGSYLLFERDNKAIGSKNKKDKMHSISRIGW